MQFVYVTEHAAQFDEHCKHDPPEMNVPAEEQVAQEFVDVFKYSPTKVLKDVQFVEVTLQASQDVSQDRQFEPEVNVPRVLHGPQL